MKKYILIITLILITHYSFSQQDPQFAHNMFNMLHTNPAYAGMNGKICANIITRRQWVGFEGAPNTTLGGINFPFKLFGLQHGVGLSLTDDRLGFLRKFQIKLAYSYHRNLGPGTLGIGVDLGIMNNQIDGEWKPPDTNHEDDPLIPSKNNPEAPSLRKMVFDMGAGVFYSIPNKFYVGFSVSHLHQPKIKYPENDQQASFLRRHYFATAGYNFRLFETPVEMKPSVFAKFDGSKIQYSINLTGLYNKKFWLGVSYRNKDAIIPMGGIVLFNGLRIGYSYELALSRLITNSKGTHEIFLGYCFDFWRAPSNYKYRCIRHL